jgi:hypothetical protein
LAREVAEHTSLIQMEGLRVEVTNEVIDLIALKTCEAL